MTVDEAAVCHTKQYRYYPVVIQYSTGIPVAILYIRIPVPHPCITHPITAPRASTPTICTQKSGKGKSAGSTHPSKREKREDSGERASRMRPAAAAAGELPFLPSAVRLRPNHPSISVPTTSPFLSNPGSHFSLSPLSLSQYLSSGPGCLIFATCTICCLIAARKSYIVLFRVHVFIMS